MSDTQFDDRLAGILLGTAVGDALGLPCENVTLRRRQRLFPGPVRHRLLFGHGMISDDTDTVWAIGGALAGATCGASGIPAEWIDPICDWPRSIRVLREVARRLAVQRQNHVSPGPVSYFWPAVLPRNLFFLVVVLLHGFRRLAPPC